MKHIGLVLSAVLVSFSAVAFAQTDATQVAPSEAQKSFDTVKSLAGAWQGTVSTTPKVPEMPENTQMQITMRVTSRGNALVHEMKGVGQPDDPTKYDHPVTMFYLDNDRLLLTHYCDAGNRPRMSARTSADNKKVEFDFLDLAGGNERGHMYHAVFRIVDANHHIEDWTYMVPGDKPILAHMDLQRVP